MLVEHTLQITALCPVDESVDIYTCTVRSDRIIPVEDILAAVRPLQTEKIFQEQLTLRLHKQLRASVETLGLHSGVQTRVLCA